MISRGPVAHNGNGNNRDEFLELLLARFWRFLSLFVVFCHCLLFFSLFLVFLSLLSVCCCFLLLFVFIFCLFVVFYLCLLFYVFKVALLFCFIFCLDCCFALLNFFVLFCFYLRVNMDNPLWMLLDTLHREECGN